MALIFNPFTGQPDFTGTGGSGTPGGSDGQLQFNDGGAFGGLQRTAMDVSGETTDAVTPVTLATIPLALNTNYRIQVDMIGRVTASTALPIVGDAAVATEIIVAQRIAGGAVVVNSGTVTTAAFAFATNTPPSIDGVASGNDILVQITGGDADTTVSWAGTVMVDSV